MSKLHVLAVHGIGNANSDYSEELRKLVYNKLEEVAVPSRGRPLTQDIHWLPAIWSGEGASLQRQLYARLFPTGERLSIPFLNRVPGLGNLTNIVAQKFFEAFFGAKGPRDYSINSIGDIFIYRSKIFGADIREKVREGIRQLRAHHRKTEPFHVSIIAHSLGTVIAYDVLHEYSHESQRRGGRPKARLDHDRGELLKGVYLSNFFTMGSPLAIFSLSSDKEHQHFLPADPPFTYRRGGVWYNFYDAQDFISFPLEPLFASIKNQQGENFVKDFEVDNSLFTGASHGGYWNNEEEVAVSIAERLRSDAAQLP